MCIYIYPTMYIYICTYHQISIQISISQTRETMANCWSVGLADPKNTGSLDLSMEGPWKDSRVSRATVGQATVILRFFLGDLLADPFGKYEHTNTGPHVEISNCWTFW